MTDPDIITLRVYFERILRDYIDAHQREHDALAANVKHEREVVDARLEGQNEWRAQLQSERGHLVQRELCDQRVASAEARMHQIERQLAEALTRAEYELAHRAAVARIDALETKVANLEGRLTTVVAGLGFAVVVFELLFKFVLK